MAVNIEKLLKRTLNPNPEQAEERYSICKSCSEFNPTLYNCKQCGCFMLVKVRLLNSECPLGKW